MKTTLSLALTFLLSGCVSKQSPAPTTTTPSSTSSSTPQDTPTCPDVCAKAQTACRTHEPKQQEDCLAKCSDAVTGGVASSSLACLAINFTCDENCP